MPVVTQIYGLTEPEDAAVVRDAGADHAGVVLDEGVDTWDSVDEPAALAIAAALGPVTLVALSLSTEPERIVRTVRTLRPRIVHLARAAGAIEPAGVRALRADLGVEVMTTVPVTGDGAVDVARAYAGVSDYLLLDSRDPSTGVVGATGLTHDWALSARVVAAVDVRVVLAGGLGPHNVADAIAAVRPWGVDSETHTSREGDRRRKDPDKVREFVRIARAAGA